MKIASFLFKLLLFFLPVQLSYHLWPKWSFVYGIRVDYLSPTFYITDILVLFLLAAIFIDDSLRSQAIRTVKRKPILISIISLLTYFIILIFLSPLPFLSLYKSIKFFEILIVAWLSYFLSPFVMPSIVPILSIGVIWSCLISLAQIINNGSLGGLFYFLGERSFRMSFPGIARAYYLGSEHLRAYGTFPHPNALAGFAGVNLLLLLISKKKQVLSWLAIFSSILLLIFTVSQNAWVSLFFTLPFFFYSFRKRFLPVFLPTLVVLSLFTVFCSGALLKKGYVTGESSLQRLELLSMSGVYISGYPLLGIKPGNFIPLLPDVREFTSNFLNRQFSWWLQPVHNIYILLLVETGFVGILLFCFFLQKILVFSRHSLFTLPLVFILLTGLWDHYWITLHQTGLLFGIVIGLLLKDATIHKNGKYNKN